MLCHLLQSPLNQHNHLFTEWKYTSLKDRNRVIYKLYIIQDNFLSLLKLLNLLQTLIMVTRNVVLKQLISPICLLNISNAKGASLVMSKSKGFYFPGNPVSVCSVNGFTPLFCKANVPNSDGEGDEQISCTLLLLEETLSQNHNTWCWSCEIHSHGVIVVVKRWSMRNILRRVCNKLKCRIYSVETCVCVLVKITIIYQISPTCKI